MKVKYLVIGAGPAGLSFARRLADRGEESFIVLEKESEPGGLCRSAIVDGSPIDIGGAHCLEMRDSRVLDFIFSFLPRDEWYEFIRRPTVVINGHEIGYPVETNIWQLPASEQAEYLYSACCAGCRRGEAMPERFEDWIVWKFGDKLAADYMTPYNSKIWSVPLDTLGTYWMYKLPDASLRDIIESCLLHEPRGTLPAVLGSGYPKKYGFGEPFLRMGDSLGDKLMCGYSIRSLDCGSLCVNGEITAQYIINTAPWETLGADFPEDIRALVSSLVHSAIDVDYYPEDIKTDADYTYYPDPKLHYHKMFFRNNYIPNSHGHWTEANSKRSPTFDGVRYHCEYAYPVSVLGKPETIAAVLDWARSRNIFGLGRWGEWEHMNSDVAIMHGMELADSLMQK